jgi:hypothetical protein
MPRIWLDCSVRTNDHFIVRLLARPYADGRSHRTMRANDSPECPLATTHRGSRPGGQLSNKIQIFKVSDFLGWQRADALRLSPSFQRRPVWKPQAKSYLIDSIVRDLPIPLVFVRERLDLNTQSTIREVVDGQQRLRTIFTYIDSSCLADYEDARDGFAILAKHNPDLADKSFASLDPGVQKGILSYEFGTYVLPPETEDRDVLAIFARINSTGVRLNDQELRNAEYFGDLKKLMYQLALESLENWRVWKVFSEEAIARMEEVEFVSDLTLSLTNRSVTGKTQQRLNKLYRDNDDAFAEGSVVATRFRRVIRTIDDAVSHSLSETVFRSAVNFYSLWMLIYDLHFGLDSKLSVGSKAASIPHDRLARAVLEASNRIRSEDVPEDVLDAIRRASSDTGRRQTRHSFLRACYAQAR